MRSKNQVAAELNELFQKVNSPLTNLEKEGPTLFLRYVSLFTEAGNLGPKGNEIFDKIMEAMKSSMADEIRG